MFLDSLGVPGMPETTPFRGFGGPKVVMKPGSMPRRQNCTIEDEEEEGGVPQNGRKCDAKKNVQDRQKSKFSFSMLCPHDVSRESGGAWDTGNDSVSRYWWPQGRHEGRVDAK